MESNQILQSLEQLGLSNLEAKVYLKILEIGEALPKQISDQIQTPRATLYQLFPKLTDRGLIQPVIKGKRRYFKAQRPDLVLSQLKEKVNDLELQLPDLLAIYQAKSDKPRVQFFAGHEGIKLLYRDTLKEEGGIVRAFLRVTNIHQEIEKYLTSYYVPERIRRKVEARNLVSSDKLERVIIPTGKQQLRENRYIDPNKFPFQFEGLIFGDKVGFSNYEAGSQLGAIMIESEEIAKSMRSLFDFAWQIAERVKI